VANLFDTASPAIQENIIRDVQEMVRRETGRTIDHDQAINLAREILARAKSREALYRVSTARLRRLVSDLSRVDHATIKKTPAQLDREIAQVVGKMTPEQREGYQRRRRWGHPAHLAFKAATERPLSKSPPKKTARSHATIGDRSSYPFDLAPGDIVMRRDIKGRKKYRVSHLGSSGDFVQVYTREVGGGGHGAIVTFDRSQLRHVS
jgi:hypothetical protein